MRLFFSLVIASLFMNGCSPKQTAGGVATAVSLAAVVPVSPLTEGYRSLSGSKKHIRQQAEAWRQKFDPLYRGRLKALNRRNAEKDAKDVYERTGPVFLSRVKGKNDFVGLLKKDGLSTHMEVLTPYPSDPTIARLETLLFDDPVQSHETGHKYNSRVYDCFLSKVYDYRLAFNHTMSKLSDLYKVVYPRKIFKDACERMIQLKDINEKPRQ
ncbi:hypothetical protein QGN29_05605 [Temperatibacter marinus]|uniref:Uncharacterized protein n=1 Tax=Temperatibacter marinus TaxID=1456591 RepID=A0AA52HA42_9PROT|nr:hypothetical protein [Temperatibacter marinus]WND03846.1 hypothetical protein QGN29_05605 [Temperatibacter marinus]